MTIQHKTFGNGKVTALSDTIATIQFAGGDAVTGAATVILAMGAGKTAAYPFSSADESG